MLLFFVVRLGSSSNPCFSRLFFFFFFSARSEFRFFHDSPQSFLFKFQDFFSACPFVVSQSLLSFVDLQTFDFLHGLVSFGFPSIVLPLPWLDFLLFDLEFAK